MGDNNSKQNTEPVSDRKPYPLYITEELKGEINERFRNYNAKRVLCEKEDVGKHDVFLEALIRAGLENDDLEKYIRAEADGDIRL